MALYPVDKLEKLYSRSFKLGCDDTSGKPIRTDKNPPPSGSAEMEEDQYFGEQHSASILNDFYPSPATVHPTSSTLAERTGK